MFKSDLVLVDAVARNNYWWMSEPLRWSDPIFGDLTIPVGFGTDLESVPFMVRGIPWVDSVFDPDGVTRRPAAGHDYLYAWRGWDKDKADAFLKAAILSEGGSASVAQTVYLGVHWFGGSAWRRDGLRPMSANFRTLADYQAWKATNPILNPT